MQTAYFPQWQRRLKMSDNAISVRQLNLYVKSLLEGDKRLNFVTVTGEISNFKNHYASGHWYFTLKDSFASVRCVMFRANAMRVVGEIQDGMSVTVTGRASLYEKDGQYQFYVESLSAEGSGDIALKFRLTKQKLEKEGLFDPDSKRSLCPFPKKIAVITSDTGAAVHDIINVTSRRYPLCDLLIYPVAVQGVRAVPEMLAALDAVYARDDIDTIIIGRGGGSEEDLAAFNDEALARKLYESPFAVISAVGHETDFTIADFVSDVRAPTPSAAAELAVPDMAELSAKLEKLKAACVRSLKSAIQQRQADVFAYKAYFSAERLLDLLNARSQHIDRLSDRIQTRVKAALNSHTAALEKSVIRLDTLSPLKTLARGYAVAHSDGRLVKSVTQLSENDSLTVDFSDGTAECRVTSVKSKNS